MHFGPDSDERAGRRLNRARTHLLDNVRAELLDRQRAHVPGELADDSIAEAVVVKVEDILNNIVAIRVLNERERVICNLLDKLHALVVACVVYATLQDPAAIILSSDLNAVLGDGVVDELTG